MAVKERKISMLKCSINGKEYDLVQGITFSEEYNETLDSGSIILDHIEKTDFKPYDDVFIYDGTFNGYNAKNTQVVAINYENDFENKQTIFNAELYNAVSQAISQNVVIAYYTDSGLTNKVVENTSFYIYGGNLYLTIGLNNYIIMLDSDKYVFDFSNKPFYQFEVQLLDIEIPLTPVAKPSFYRHLLIDQFSEERLNPVQNIYKYKIQLFSETKKLELIQLPNISITQPLDANLKKSVYDYLVQFVKLYGTKVKRVKNSTEHEWYYDDKYVVDPALEDEFGEIYCPDFSLYNPSLRDLLNQLVLVKDMIIYVQDDVIKALKIGETTTTFNTNKITKITGSLSSDNYVDGLKRTYQQALSEKNTIKRIEYLGFRNSDVALMTLNNMRLETRYPIYKVNRVYMCYYKNGKIIDTTDNSVVRDIVFLCRQDITDLVMLEEKRRTLSEDWEDFEISNPPSTIQELAEYKIATVGYGIGSNIIDGWGEMYSYVKMGISWWKEDVSYIQNIFEFVDSKTPYGVDGYGLLSKELEQDQVIQVANPSDRLDNIYGTFGGSEFTGANKLKLFFFEVEYDGFYSGTLIHSKDNDRDDLISNDNASSSLTLLEKDGLFQKEKANRFGNMAYILEARYDSLSEMQPLGSVYDDGVVIYHREYSIWNNGINVIYYGTKDYILRNYFTSVYAKHRPFAVANYNESVKRSENKKSFILLSKEKEYYEQNIIPNDRFTYDNFNGNFLENIISAFKPSVYKNSLKPSNENQLNGACIIKDNEVYLCDFEAFVSGYSLCFNVGMFDNVSAGEYIKNPLPPFNSFITDVSEDYTGSSQSFYNILDSNDTGFIKDIAFRVFHNINAIKSAILENPANAQFYYALLFKLPHLNTLNYSNAITYNGEFNKDNKEVLDLTMQFDVYTNDKDIVFSDWLMRLSDLLGNYPKIDQDQEILLLDVDGSYSLTTECVCNYKRSEVYIPPQVVYYNYRPYFVLKINQADLSSIQVGDIINGSLVWDKSFYEDNINARTAFSHCLTSYNINLTKIENIIENNGVIEKIIVSGYANETYRKGLFGGYSAETKNITLELNNITGGNNFDNLDLSDGDYYFSMVHCSSSNEIIFDNDSIPDYQDMMAGLNSITTYNATISGDTQTANIYQNMYVVDGIIPVKQNLVYENYKIADITYDSELGRYTVENSVGDKLLLSNYKVSEVFSYNENVIRIDLTNINPNASSVQLWHGDNESGNLNFVFGVNFTQKDFERGYIDIYMSLVNRKDTRVYNNNNVEVGEIVNYAESNLTYGEKQRYVLKSN